MSRRRRYRISDGEAVALNAPPIALVPRSTPAVCSSAGAAVADGVRRACAQRDCHRHAPAGWVSAGIGVAVEFFNTIAVRNARGEALRLRIDDKDHSGLRLLTCRLAGSIFTAWSTVDIRRMSVRSSAGRRRRGSGRNLKSRARQPVERSGSRGEVNGRSGRVHCDDQFLPGRRIDQRLDREARVPWLEPSWAKGRPLRASLSWQLELKADSDGLG